MLDQAPINTHVLRAIAVVCCAITLNSCWHVKAGQPHSTDAPPAGIFGLYASRRPAKGVGRDTVRLTKAEGTGIKIAIQLYYAQGNTCGMDGKGVWEHDHVTMTARAIDPDQQCNLRLSFRKGHVLLGDEGGRCTPVYCGAHGQLDGVELPKVR